MICLELRAHPSTPAPGLAMLEFELQRADDGGLQLRYRLRGDLGALVLPVPSAPCRKDGLWQHSCFELFVCAAGQDAYTEFNFAPSGAWALYRFRAYRQPEPMAADVPAPAISVQRDAQLYELSARLDPATLPAAAVLQLGVSAVIEAADGGLSYWALTHPADRPDFHHPDAFTLLLPMDGTPRN
jgi:hypothetical protein